MKKDEVVKYLEKLAQKLPEDQRDAFLKASAADAVAEEMAAAMKRQDEFSRESDELRAQRTAFEAKQKEVQDWYARAMPEFTQSVEARKQAELERDQARQAAQKYAETYGQLDGVPPVTVSNPAGVTKADLDRALTEMRQAVQKAQTDAFEQSAGLLTTFTPIAIRHFKEFGEVLDPAQFLTKAKELAAKPVTPFERAYEALTNDRRLTATEEATKKREQQLKDEAVRDYLSTHNIPVDSRPKESSVFFDRPKDIKAPTSEAEKMAIFTQAFNEAQAEESAKH